MSDELGVEFSTDGAGVTIKIAGEIDLASAPRLTERLEDAIERHEGDVTFDLGGVSFIDSSGLRVLLVAQSRLAALDRRARVVNPSDSVRRVLEVAGLLDALDVEDGSK